jgi:hypothetical protein
MSYDVLSQVPVEAGLVCEQGGKRYISAYYDGADPAALVIGGTVAIGREGIGAAAHNPIAYAIAASVVVHMQGVSLVATTTAGFYWFQIQGEADVLVEGTAAVSIGDTLKAVAATPHLIQDTAMGTDLLATSIGIALEATTVAGPELKLVYLLGREATVA